MLLFAISVSPASSAFAFEELVIVVPETSAIDSLSRSELYAVFFQRGKRFQDLAVPFDRDDEALRKIFYQHIAGMSLNRLRAYWAKRVFTSRGLPPKVVSIQEIKEVFIFRDKAISYMRNDEVTEDMKIVYRINIKRELGE